MHALWSLPFVAATWLALGVAGVCLAGQPGRQGAATGARPVHTYSIVARDPQTGQLGVGVQSHYFSVGPIVPWAEPGVGAVATQSLVEISYGPKGLELMRAGKSAPQALAELLAEDEGREVRQVAMIDAAGHVAAHTGKRCIAEAGHITGQQFSVQANLMLNDTVPAAMAEAYRSASGDLADRILAALQAAQGAGGDLRGQQSAALLIVEGEKTDQPYRAKLFDLRVEDHPRPLDELRRLVRLQRAYRHVDAGDTFVAQGKMDQARREYETAAKLAPEVTELAFWQAVSLFDAGQHDQALPLFRRCFRDDPNWAVLVPRLVDCGLMKDDPEGIKRILAEKP
jgi:uncharacterized Ntn-hydrolase superfamily protein